MAEQANKDEQVGFHKGALATLAKEREEMQKEAKSEKKPAGKKRPIEDMLRK